MLLSFTTFNRQFDGEYHPCDKTMGLVFKCKRWIENSVVLVLGHVYYLRKRILFSPVLLHLYIFPSHAEWDP